jgi:hypothetical protein
MSYSDYLNRIGFTPASAASSEPTPGAEGRGDNTHAGRIRGAIADLSEHVARGDMALAGEARRLLNVLAYEAGGYPQWVRDELRARGLRETP